MSQRTAVNPYTPQGNPYMPSGGQPPPVANNDEMMDGPQNPPIPQATTMPTTTAPRTMPGGSGAGGQPGVSEAPAPGTPPMKGTAMLVPIICHGCGQRGDAPLDAIIAAGACACGSEDIDIDMETEAKVSFTDMPMDTLKDTNVVSQQARCSNCFNEWAISVTDPADLIPPCPSCGSDAVSAAGTTGTVATGSLQIEGLSEGGLLSMFINMLNTARSGGDEIPGWFMKYFKRMLLPEEIASGRFISGTGGAYDWGTMGLASKHVAKAEKVMEVAAGIKETNPSMPMDAALHLAHQTIERYPDMLKTRRG